ncbi:MAG TPA: hypothetical protein VNT55_17815 [Baekduia sp.]|nr:hypothetical protein [Baekduia sp.]
MLTSIARRLHPAIGSWSAALVLGLLCIAALGVPKADALESYYCEVAVAQNTHCNEGTGGHTWRFNQDYAPAGPVSTLCQGMDNGGVVRTGTGCLNGQLVTACYGTTTVYWTAFVSFANSTAGSRELDGYTNNLVC